MWKCWLKRHNVRQRLAAKVLSVSLIRERYDVEYVNEIWLRRKAVILMCDCVRGVAKAMWQTLSDMVVQMLLVPCRHEHTALIGMENTAEDRRHL